MQIETYLCQGPRRAGRGVGVGPGVTCSKSQLIRVQMVTQSY